MKTLLIGLLFSLNVSAQEPTATEVILYGDRPKECPGLLERAMAANKQKDAEILELKLKIQQLELKLLRK